MSAVAALAWLLGPAAASWAAVGLVRRLLLRFAILDRPNARSSHAAPVPRGGGIGMLAVVLPLWSWLAFRPDAAGLAWIVPAGALGLALVSWLDDLEGLPAAPRLLLHLTAVAAGIAALPGPVFGGLLPPVADAVVAGLAWAWFVNLFNFMDGIDGIAGVQTAAMGLGAALVAALAGSPALAEHGLLLAGAALGFLAWNWHPARVFLGDVGSVPLGYLLGYLCLGLAAGGWWAEALILPAYYLADATLTLLRRVVRGAAPWQAHREHFYQRAVARGLRHDAVAGAVLVGDAALVALAALSAGRAMPGWLALGLAAAAVAVLLAWLAGGLPRRRS